MAISRVDALRAAGGAALMGLAMACAPPTSNTADPVTAELPSSSDTTSVLPPTGGGSSIPAASATSSSGGKVAKLEGRAVAPNPTTVTSTAESSTPTVASPAGSQDSVVLWATGATATSNYGSNAGDGWNATAAIGEPDVDPECRDDTHAWASLSRSEVATLTVTFDDALWVSRVDVYQTLNPGQVTRIELLGPDGARTSVFEGVPETSESCPVQGFRDDLALNHPVNSVAITVDQSVTGAGWAEIDAVSILGVFAT